MCFAKDNTTRFFDHSTIDGGSSWTGESQALSDFHLFRFSGNFLNQGEFHKSESLRNRLKGFLRRGMEGKKLFEGGIVKPCNCVTAENILLDEVLPLYTALGIKFLQTKRNDFSAASTAQALNI